MILIPKLTKEEAIREHRKMWNWIADQYEQGYADSVMYLKTRYLEQYEHGKWCYITNKCFCCRYDTTKRAEIDCRGRRCCCCPIQWKSNVNQYMCCDHFEIGDELGLYSYLCILSDQSMADHMADHKELAKLAREIANLPERK